MLNSTNNRTIFLIYWEILFLWKIIIPILKVLLKEIYEPTIKEDTFEGYKVEHDLDEFKNTSDVIIANRMNEELEDEMDKVYTRDIYRNN